eukprot:TRINITY_DN90945_c0_g1_i1.p1 TRINITY_DN90945_c0_g1~~TRINITY_DN90945_c0_g1_i1.p1  ORF type:complete len:596 (+),score=112.19 TRINITY_DN90945_c0_g1_i1:52-1839(+)
MPFNVYQESEPTAVLVFGVLLLALNAIAIVVYVDWRRLFELLRSTAKSVKEVTKKNMLGDRDAKNGPVEDENQKLVDEKLIDRSFLRLRNSFVLLLSLSALINLLKLKDLALGTYTESLLLTEVLFLTVYCTLLLATWLAVKRCLPRWAQILLCNVVFLCSGSLTVSSCLDDAEHGIMYKAIFFSLITCVLLSGALAENFWMVTAWNLLHACGVTVVGATFQDDRFTIFWNQGVPLLNVLTVFWSWRLSTSELLQVEKEIQDNSLAHKHQAAITLLSRICDACFFVDHKFRILEDAPQLSVLLFQGGASLKNKRLQQFLATDRDRDNFLAEMTRNDENPMMTGAMHLQLRDGMSNILQVEMFHVETTVGANGQREHFLGIRELVDLRKHPDFDDFADFGSVPKTSETSLSPQHMSPHISVEKVKNLAGAESGSLLPSLEDLDAPSGADESAVLPSPGEDYRPVQNCVLEFDAISLKVISATEAFCTRVPIDLEADLEFTDLLIEKDKKLFRRQFEHCCNEFMNSSDMEHNFRMPVTLAGSSNTLSGSSQISSTWVFMLKKNEKQDGVTVHGIMDGIKRRKKGSKPPSPAVSRDWC